LIIDREGNPIIMNVLIITVLLDHARNANKTQGET
jgi:hypothetical protein